MQKKLNQLEATAICGNDISSSCLYVSALAIAYAGQYAWISLLMVGVVLFFFRKIYGEVVGALPLNGGAYNALLNTSKKSVASLAASLTVLSYVATAVISASEAIKYAHSLYGGIPVIPSTIFLLAIFMGLVILGIGESSKVAIAIFLFHLFSLTVLCGFCIWFLLNNGTDVLSANFSTPVKGGVLTALFLGFSAAMLGISGFESSANYVEEQAKGVFSKTLRNMWIVVTIFNPLIAFLALAIIPKSMIAEHQDALLSIMGKKAGGNWLSFIIGIDAALVLSGAVLTSFVGVGGLMKRMSLDRILPNILLKKTQKGTNYLIYIVFFALCVSILWVTQGDLAKLAGVYTIAFLSVMILFGIGNLLLKVNRARLPRPERSTWLGLFIGVFSVFVAIVGNIILNPSYLGIFFQYLIPTLLVVFFMFYRMPIYKTFLKVITHIFPQENRLYKKLNKRVTFLLDRLNQQEFVYFTRNDSITTLNKVLLYVHKNEPTSCLKVVAILKEGESLPDSFENDVAVLDKIYPRIKIQLIVEKGLFNPDKIQELSARWNIPTNFMFISSPTEKSMYKIQELGEVRLIM